ncbi:MAG: hypothetical protein U0X40_01025 [Ferruginibacter sp.]
MQRFINFFIALCLTQVCMAQNSDCKVMAEKLKGTYQGECSDGKANGEGFARGEDAYSGTFKNGLPNGLGKYTWSNGDYYKGNWKKGQRDGKGEMHYTSNGKDSVVQGFWKRDAYEGKYEVPYIVHDKTFDVSRVEVSRQSKKGATVVVGEQTMSGQELNGVSGNAEFKIGAGNYLSVDSKRVGSQYVTTFQNVSFPFRVTMYYSGNSVDVELLEEGVWNISVMINK